MGNNIQIFGRTFSDVSSITVNNTSSSAVKYVQEPNFESVTVYPNNLLSQNQSFSTPDLDAYRDNNFSKRMQIRASSSADAYYTFIDKFFINIVHNEKLHINATLTFLSENIDETIYIDTDYTVTGSVINLVFTSSIVNSKITSIKISMANNQQMNISIKANISADEHADITGQIIITKTIDKIGTINLNFSSDPRFSEIEKRLAYRSSVYSSSAYVSEWCDSLSKIEPFMFAGQPFSGSFTFNNVSFVNQYAFAVPWLGGGASLVQSCTINFLRSSGTFLSQNAFQQNGMIREINAPYTSEIPSYFCYSCTNLTTLSFPECTNIRGSAFCSCGNLTTISFPKCTNIEQQAFYSCSKLTTISFPECISIGYQAFYNCSSLITISFPECITIGGNAFSSCRNLTTISFPKCTSIDYNAFQSCSKLTAASFPECISIGYQAFQGCSSLTTISFPECTYLGSTAFYSCNNLTTASFPKCTFLGSGTFYNCSNLTTASFPECTFIGNRAFYNCGNLTTISFPKCTSIEYSAFQQCSNLTAASFPECTFIGASVFYYCSNLTVASFPECTNMDPYAFYGCGSLTTISLPKCISIGMNAFYNCKKLESAYFMGSSIPSIGANIFQLTPIANNSYIGYYGSIYVPSSLLASYKTATNWAQYSARMVGI